MDFVWGSTAILNALLCILLFFRGYYIRYSWLFASTIYSVFADVVMYYATVHDPSRYADLCRFIYFLCLGINGMIIVEAFLLRDRRVQFPVEIQLGMELIALLANRAGFLMAGYYMQCGLRITNLLMIVYFVMIFSEEPSYE